MKYLISYHFPPPATLLRRDPTVTLSLLTLLSFFLHLPTNPNTDQTHHENPYSAQESQNMYICMYVYHFEPYFNHSIPEHKRHTCERQDDSYMSRRRRYTVSCRTQRGENEGSCEGKRCAGGCRYLLRRREREKERGRERERERQRERGGGCGSIFRV